MSVEARISVWDASKDQRVIRRMVSRVRPSIDRAGGLGLHDGVHRRLIMAPNNGSSFDLQTAPCPRPEVITRSQRR